MSRYTERKFETKTGRASLTVRQKFYVGLTPDVRLALYRGVRGDGWFLKHKDGGRFERLATAETSALAADNVEVLDFLQAKDRARKLVGADKHKEAPVTIAEALDAYEAHLKATGGSLFNVEYPRKYFRDTHLMSRPLPLLKSDGLRDWRNGLLDELSPSSVTRLCKVVRACFNLAAEHDERVHANRKAWKIGLASLPESGTARNEIMLPDKVRQFYGAAYNLDAALGLLMHTLSVSGARPSQAVRARVSDFIDDPTAPKIMMPRSAKGGSKERNVKREQRYMLPITLELARRLRLAIEGRKPDEYLLLRADHLPWNPNPSNDYRDEVRAIMTAIGEDPDRVTAYCLRHSNIVQMLRRGASAEFVARLHDTSEVEIRKHYARFIVHHHEDFARSLLIDNGPLCNRRTLTT